MVIWGASVVEVEYRIESVIIIINRSLSKYLLVIYWLLLFKEFPFKIAKSVLGLKRKGQATVITTFPSIDILVNSSRFIIQNTLRHSGKNFSACPKLGIFDNFSAQSGRSSGKSSV